MTDRIKEMYKSACKNKAFLEAIKSADGDKKPSLFSSDLDKHLFVSVYYGWLVGKHGIKWSDFL